MDKDIQKTSTAQPEVPISSLPEVLKGHYSNAIKVAITDSEMTLDFAFVYALDEKTKKGEHQSRIIVNKDFAQKIADSISKTISIHKEKQQKKVK